MNTSLNKRIAPNAQPESASFTLAAQSKKAIAIAVLAISNAVGCSLYSGPYDSASTGLGGTGGETGGKGGIGGVETNGGGGVGGSAGSMGGFGGMETGGTGGINVGGTGGTINTGGTGGNINTGGTGGSINTGGTGGGGPLECPPQPIVVQSTKETVNSPYKVFVDGTPYIANGSPIQGNPGNGTEDVVVPGSYQLVQGRKTGADVSNQQPDGTLGDWTCFKVKVDPACDTESFACYTDVVKVDFCPNAAILPSCVMPASTEYVMVSYRIGAQP